MHRNSITMAVAVAVLIVVSGPVGASPPAFAAPTGCVAPSGQTHGLVEKRSTVAPISTGYVEVTQPFGSAVYHPGISSAVGPFAANSLGAQVVVAPGVSALVTLQLPVGQTVSSGTTYVNGSGASIAIQGGLGSCNPGTAAVEVDQIVRDENSAPTSYAIQFFCEDFIGSAIFRGTIAYNMGLTTPHQGYYTYEADGTLFGFGNDNYLVYLGDLGALPLNRPIVGMARTPDGGGYWMVASDGGIFAFGDASYYGSTGGIHLNRPIVGMATTSDGAGYWLVAADGGVFAFGDAMFYGSMGGAPLNQSVVGMAASPGGGYWLVAADGGVFAFGNAAYYGSTGSIRLNKPVVGIAPTPDGKGYWFVATDGGIFSFGDAQFYGSTGGLRLTSPVVGMAGTGSGTGYWLVASDGGIFSFNAPFDGSLGGLGITDVAGIAS